MRRPILGLAITPREDPLLPRFLVVAARRCSVRQADPAEAVDAWVVTDDSHPALTAAEVPVLVWTRDLRRARATWPRSAILLHPGGASGIRDDGAQLTLSVPEPALDTTTVSYVAPLIRARWRNRYGMPSSLIVTSGAEAWSPDLPLALRDTALAVATVVVATGDGVLSALAWGAPTVTDVSTAERLGLGKAVRAAPAAGLAEAARDLAGSPVGMAELSWLGRRLVEARFDLVSAVSRTLTAAQLPRDRSDSDPLPELLDEMRASEQIASSIIQQVNN